MRTLEQYLLLESQIKDQTIKPYSLNIIRDGDIIWLLASKKDKTTKVNITPLVWGSFPELYQNFIWSDMLSKGYVLITLDGGWIVKSPTGEDYQLTDNTCTCPHFLHGLNKQGRCKHLVFRDAELNYRKRQLEYSRTY